MTASHTVSHSGTSDMQTQEQQYLLMREMMVEKSSSYRPMAMPSTH